jgi:hypothetical protein
VPRVLPTNNLKDVNVLRPCCWYGDKKEPLNTGIRDVPVKGKQSPEAKRNLQGVTILLPGNGGDKVIRSRDSSGSENGDKKERKMGYELYRRPKELPYMTFEESQEEKRVTSNESEIWGEMAFVICTKSKQDIK